MVEMHPGTSTAVFQKWGLNPSFLTHVLFQDAVESTLGEKINKENCVEIANAAATLDLPNLRRKSMNFLIPQKRAKNSGINFDKLDNSVKLEMFDLI